MTNGLQRGVCRLFDSSGYLFLLALDHAQMGVMPGLEQPEALMDSLAESALGGYILNVGLARRMAKAPLDRKKLVLRSSSAGSQLASEYSTIHTNHVSPETALMMGADSVLMMAVLGGADYRSLQKVGEDIDAFHRFSIPVIVEILSADFSKTNTFDVQYHGARVAAEMGADVVKAFYVDGFDKVASCCTVPLILAGGPKDKDIVEVARRALLEGARGFAFGRNIFQARDPAAVVASLAGLLD
ncbi:MAG: fructose-bisphosphate aldolase class I [Spirochaetes bacterium]|nr:MAG: fructose-bisphosphate aldolase class I [Spirochaetota bacterium]